MKWAKGGYRPTIHVILAMYRTSITCCFQQHLNVTHRWESEEWYAKQCAEGGDNFALPCFGHSIAIAHRAKRYLQQKKLASLNCRKLCGPAQ